MQQTRLIHIDEVGPVSFERSMRAKRISISIKPFRKPRVAVPPHSSFQKATEFAISRKNWLIENIDKIRRYEKTLSVQAIASTPVDRQRATKLLTRRLEELAFKYGFSYNRVTIRNQKTRWGSCSANNNISLNVQLARLPQELADYVILHELVHTRIKNHSHAFWQELDRLVGSSKKFRAKMKNYLPLIYPESLDL
ncbi:MAG: M48 family metallopeptidase [Dehalococcoidales bacterium]